MVQSPSKVNNIISLLRKSRLHNGQTNQRRPQVNDKNSKQQASQALINLHAKFVAAKARTTFDSSSTGAKTIGTK